MPNVEEFGFSRIHRKETAQDSQNINEQIPLSDVNQVFGDNSFNGSLIESLSVNKLTAGTLRIGSYILGGASGYNNGTGFFLGDEDGSNVWKFFIGNSAGDKVTWNGSTLSITGSITATTGSIGGFDIGSDYIRDAGNSFGLASTVTGADDVRFWAGATYTNRATAPFRITEAGALTATSATITGAITTSAGSSLDGSYLTAGSVASASANLALRGWTQTCAFSVTDADTVAWGAGTFTASDGTSYSIGASNTGNMAAKTYIYLDIAVSTTAYQTTTTASTAVGNGKVLVAIAQNGTGEATFMVVNNNSYNIDASNIVALSITANEIAASTITAGKMSVSQLSAIAADLGAITAGTIVLPSGGFMRSGQTAYDTGTGFYIGNDSGTPKFSLGNSSGNKLTWDGTTLSITGSISVSSIPNLPGDENLWARWGMDEGSGTSIIDLSGNSRTGTSVGTTYATGKAGQALSFNSTDYVTLPSTGMPTSALTVSVWVKADSHASSRRIIWNNWSVAGDWIIYSDATNWIFGIKSAGPTDQLITYAHSSDTASWHHLVGTYDGTTQRFYVDGTEVGTALTHTTTLSTGGTFRLSHDAFDTFQGSIDEVRIYSTAATANNIKALYGNPSAVSTSGTITAKAGLLGDWVITAGSIYSLTSGTPSSSPNNGVVLSSTNQVMTVYEGTNKRLEIGKLASSIYGLKIYATDGSTVIYETSDTQQKIAGWNFTDTVLRSGATDAASNVLIDSANSLIRLGATSGNYLTLDGANTRLRTSTYSAGLQGWSIESDGSAEFANITARGEFHSQVLSYGEIHTTAGSQMVAKSAGKLKNDATSVTSPTTFNVDIEDPDTGHSQVFAVNDILRVKDGSGNDNYWTVSSVSDQTTFYRYVCTKNSGSNATFRAGAAVVDLGVSGDGFLYLTADDSNGPFYSVRTHAGSPWTTTTERVRLGNLNGFLDYSSDLFGLGIGETNKYFKYDPTNGLRVAGQLNSQVELTAGENLTAGNLAVVKTHTTILSDGGNTAFYATHDARVDQANPTTNYGTATTATVGADAGGNANWFFMKWDLSDASFPTVATRCFIRLFWSAQSNLAGVATNHRINVYEVTGADWDESTLTWNNKPAISGSASDSWSVSPNDSIFISESRYNQSHDGAMIFLDITTLYNGWKSGSNNYGVAIRLEKAAGGETTDVRITDIRTSEYTPVPGKNAQLFVSGIMPSNPGRVYKADADFIDLSNGELGFVVATATSGNPVTLQTKGLVTGLSGLTTGATYFLSTTAGGISTAVSHREIGVALSTTSLLLNIKPPAPLTFNVQYTYGGYTVAGADTSTVNKIPLFFGVDYSNLRFCASTSVAGSEIFSYGEVGGQDSGAFCVTGTTFKNGSSILSDGTTAPFNDVDFYSITTNVLNKMDVIQFEFDTDNTNNNTIKGFLTVTP